MHRIAALLRTLFAELAFFMVAIPLVIAFFASMTGIGGWVGRELAGIPNLQAFKILNVVGMALDIAGVVFLSRLVSRNNRLQELIGDWLPFPLVLAAFDVALGVHFEMPGLVSLPSGQAVGRIANIVLPSLALLGLAVLFGGGFAPIRQYLLRRLKRPEGTAEVRANIVGGAFLTSGLLIQLVAAVMDLYS